MDPSDRGAWDQAHRRDAGAAIPQRVRDRLPPLPGLRVLHLQCGEGTATAELAAAGALVTGVEGDPQLLEVARRQAPDLPWVHADPHQLPGELLRGRFDLVFGSLAGVTALEAWAGGAFAALRPLGWLVVYDRHPAAGCLDAALHWREDYFAGRTLGDIVTAVSHAGLTVKRLEEYPARNDAWRRQDPRVPGEFLLRAEKAQ